MADTAARPRSGAPRRLTVLLVLLLAGVLVVLAVVASQNQPGSASRVTTAERPTSTTTADATAPVRLLRITAHGVTAQLEASSPTCVRVVTTPPTAPAADVCLTDGEPLLSASASTVAGTTVVHGIGEGIRSVRGMVSPGQVDIPDTRQAAYNDRWVFLFVVNAPDADGIVLGQPVSDDEAPPGATFGSGMTGMDPNLQREETVQLPPPAAIRFVFEHQRQIWAHLETGSMVRLTGSREGAGGGMVSPDRSTVLFGRIAGVFDEMMALNVRTGETRAVGTAGGAAFSAGGALAVALPFDDSPAPVVIAIHDARTFAERRRIRLGMSDVVGAVSGIGWSRGESQLLVATGGESSRLFLVDVDHGRVRRLDGSPSGSLQFGRGDREGRHFALRTVDGRLEVGTLSLGGGRATFDSTGVVDRSTPEAVLGEPARYFGALGKVRAEMVGDAAFRLVPSETDAALVGDGENLFLVSATGELTYLWSEVRWAGSP